MLSDDFTISQLAIPAVSLLISFLAYSSQYFFLHFEAAPLRKDELWKINIFALCIWICYFRACFVDPGRLPTKANVALLDHPEKDTATGRQRWCRRCEAYKPPRAHHCKTCKRCIPKMDHHCPWTSNCVSHFTFPHFIRFLFYAVVGMGYLETLLWERASIVWSSRYLPSYLGPSVGQLIHLLLLFVINSMTVFALFILLVRSLWSLLFNTTTIESWEIERHETLVRRSRVLGGYLDAPGGKKIRIKKQEFPYDIGLWSNIKDGMGGSINIISWFWPLAATPDHETGWAFEINDFEDPGVSWPPPDPDRIPLPARPLPEDGSELLKSYSSAREEIEAFKRRQAEDFERARPSPEIQKRKRFHERHKQNDDREDDEQILPGPVYGDDSDEGEESWRNAEGERLRDFGVDEDVEFYDEDEIPLGILMKQRNQGR
ncbi:Palmitoyltransferase pfa4 [Penicillium canariense]|uniref:Palmitoyltransferase PFA4 n=1 Tax=Penicillium canariense TaxID=189055 RepID=A0A9W9HU15_9EURO|nr:Palmitoyltransferase pfa4 [Penicillium canariense]KAJ5157733.1 Palmitoyltransferase pfa4 [Penicillium canariense]